jgi:hypothetical protein
MTQLNKIINLHGVLEYYGDITTDILKEVIEINGDPVFLELHDGTLLQYNPRLAFDIVINQFRKEVGI